MRTTLTIDDDLMQRLKEEAHRRRVPFRDVLNAALRKSLDSSRSKRRPPTIRVYASRLRPGFDPAGFNKLADELEDDALAAKLSRGR
ncbi:MAG: hypothetical protein U1F25_14460 [Rubrivivax sp.]